LLGHTSASIAGLLLVHADFFIPDEEMKKALKELQKSFQPYSVLWDQWTKYSLCGLTEEDIYIIQVQLSNKFTFTHYDLVMFYNKPDKILQIVQKLDSNYSEFQEWATRKFLGWIIQMALRQGVHSFLEKPIIFLNLSNDLKKCVLSFGFETLKELVENCNDNDLLGEYYFKQPLMFKNVLDFLTDKDIAEKIVAPEFVSEIN